MVPGLPIRDCARDYSNRAQMCPQLSAIDLTAKTFFERLYLVLGLRKIVPWVNYPYAPTTPTIHPTTISRFLCNFFPRMAPHFFVIMIHQVIWPSPGTHRTPLAPPRRLSLKGQERNKKHIWTARQVNHDLTSRFCCSWCSTLFNYNRYFCTGAFFDLIEWIKDYFLDLYSY